MPPISAPAPKPITAPVIRSDGRRRTATTAPMMSDMAANPPQKAADSALSDMAHSFMISLHRHNAMTAQI